jgi:hypothetical protein
MIFVTRQQGRDPRNCPPCTAAHPPGGTQNGTRHMWRLFKFLMILLILAGLALIAYAYVGPILFPADFAAPTQQITAPVTLEVD